PTPSRLRKIKRISLKAFLYLKGLFKDFRRETPKVQFGTNSLSRRAPRINNLETRIHLAPPKKNGNAIYHDYEPTRIDNTRNSSFWQWRRVAEWYRYINDPIENINGHMTT
ncbi:MAG: hypothetical protein Q8R30_01185, partial [bacterium]|nr:hypothetical protein [bacterium]